MPDAPQHPAVWRMRFSIISRIAAGLVPSVLPPAAKRCDAPAWPHRALPHHAPRGSPASSGPLA
ncbi:hypothetical protein CBM2586_B130302 [Cupriavidus phytorum]|uniref:Uncharacterized protein n=1 Tax=Cupriavidus taiwanensis TaxID=164546 RepID=A0A976AAA2_9BURK|nr:hypothetical protein CBM2586_B130302 [Cupriavidus taiwanensis]